MRTPRFALLATATVTVLGTAMTSYAAAAPSAEAVAVTCQGERATVVGTPGDNVLRGGPGRDVISGLAGQDRIFGLGGDDVLCGGDGADLLDGGAGDDRLDGGRGGVQLIEGTPVHAGDELTGGAGDDRIDPGANGGSAKVTSFGVDTVSFADANGVRVDLRKGVATGAGRDRLVVRPMWLVLSPGDDRVRARTPVGVSGGAGDDEIRTGAGDDAVAPDDDARFRLGGARIGSGGDDEVDTGGGDDWVEILAGDDVVDTGAGDDDIESGKGRDVIRAGAGDDDVFDHGRTADDIDAGRGRDDVTDDVMGERGERVSMGPREADVRERLSLTSPRRVVWDLATGLADVGGTTVELGWAAKIFPDGQRRWTIRGTAEADYVHVTFSAGTSFSGLGGNDKFLGDFEEADLFDGGDGVDSYLGDERRNNTCVAVERDVAGACRR